MSEWGKKSIKDVRNKGEGGGMVVENRLSVSYNVEQSSASS